MPNDGFSWTHGVHILAGAESILSDLRYAARGLRKTPGFTAASLLILTLGIGATTAIFSVVNSVLLKPALLPDPDRLLMFLNTSPEGSSLGASPAELEHWRQQVSVVEDVSGFRLGSLDLTGGTVPEHIQSAQVSADFFRLFGADTIRGRTFSVREVLPNGPRSVVLSYSLWNRRFGADPEIVGKTLSIGGAPYEVIGVLRPGFDFRDFGEQPDLFVPFQFEPKSTDQSHFFQAAGRLKPGVTLAQANAQLRVSASEYRRQYPRFGLASRDGFAVEPVREALVRNVRSSLLVLACAVGFLLLIACANVANLLLGRAVSRRREFAIRAAIGAGRGRIMRQLLAESLLLSLTGAVAGTALGSLGIRALLTVNTANLPRVGQDGSLVLPDWRVLAFTVLVAVVTGILCGLIPTLHSSTPDLSGMLKASGGRGTGFRQNKARTILVVGEVALAVVLLVGSALLIRTSLALTAVHPGFNPQNVLTMRTSLNAPRFAKSAAVARLFQDGIERLSAIPGVLSAAATCCMPLEDSYSLRFIIVGRGLKDRPYHGGAEWMTVSPGYFRVFQIPLLRGRTFTDRDEANSTPVVLINQVMARRYWPDSDPLNDRIWIGQGLTPLLAAEPPRQIVGIVGSVRDDGLDSDPQPATYVLQAQVPDAFNAYLTRLRPMKWVVRTRNNPLSLSSAIQLLVRKVTGMAVTDIRSMDAVVTRSTSRQRFNMLLMTFFGAAALLLATVGVYGMISYSVEQRTQEIGIRLALGAGILNLRLMVVTQGMRLALAGVALGVTAALVLTRLMATLLYGVDARDPLVFAGVPVLLTAVSCVAVCLPAVRATRIDPVVALRSE